MRVGVIIQARMGSTRLPEKSYDATRRQKKFLNM